MDTFVCPLDCLRPISICTDIVRRLFVSHTMCARFDRGEHVCICCAQKGCTLCFFGYYLYCDCINMVVAYASVR